MSSSQYSKCLTVFKLSDRKICAFLFSLLHLTLFRFIDNIHKMYRETLEFSECLQFVMKNFGTKNNVTMTRSYFQSFKKHKHIKK